MNKYQRARAKFVKTCRRVTYLDHKFKIDFTGMTGEECMEAIYRKEDAIIKELGLRDRDHLMTLRMYNTLVRLRIYPSLKWIFDQNFKNKRK